MIQFFSKLQFDAISFWSGFIAATLLWWLIRFVRPGLKRGLLAILAQYRSWKELTKNSSERRYRGDLLKYIQKHHLSSSLFALDEILIPPRFLAPPPLLNPDSPPPHEEVISRLIPYTPDWPEMASAYNVKTLDIVETLQYVDKLAIIGNQGSGKTTTLSYIVTLFSRRNSSTEICQEFIPIYIHIADLLLPQQEDQNPLSTIINGISHNIPNLTQSQLTKILENSFNQGKALLLLDGFDETFANELSQAINFVKSIISHYPHIKIVVAACASNLDDLPGLGFHYFSLVSWGTKSQAQFIQKWNHLWMNLVENPDQRKEGNNINPSFINGWLLNLESVVNPFDFTLKVWAAYAGDSLGPRLMDAIESYLRRIIVDIPKTKSTLALLATILAVNMDSTFSENEAKKWLHEGEKETNTLRKARGFSPKKQEEIVDWDISTEAIKDLMEVGILKQCVGNRLRFVHPLIFAYFAGSSIPPEEMLAFLNQSPSGMKNTIKLFFPYHPVLDKYIATSLSTSKDPLLRDRLNLGRWLPNIYQYQEIQNRILKGILKDIQNNLLPMGLKMRLFTALITSRNPIISELLRDLINSKDSSVCQLAVLGIGFLRNIHSLDVLVKKFNDSAYVRQSACFALVNIGSKPALEAVASALLSGDERLALAAAEAFASHPKDGHPVLKEGSTVEDILVRRATINGLRKVNETWAVEILEKMQIEDPQWVIKDAAAQAIQDLSELDPAFPVLQPPLEDLPWLIAFAGERGLGISPGKSALDMLYRVINEGNEEEILAALDQLKIRGETNIIPLIYPLLYNDNPLLKESAYNLIWQIASMGVNIPSLEQVGFTN